MSNEPSYATLQQAIARITEIWPDAASWPELRAVAALVPGDPALLSTRLPDAVRDSVTQLLEKLHQESMRIWPFGICELFGDWISS
ncbi:MAG: hypothetical protein C3F15_15845 [Holophagae bacterium]|nr:MAG: hypothetical protein C3F15_15845 [Holophagae bacterium]